ncbi:hypothetical protein N5P37_001255 [Trichoderma harzianum]|uniref:Uncharacterized protein n=1 Tax=Trichoderma harzianum CBS 226.95 TaxID=983964 RepID=A0A2T4ARR1_TRIHA|nr:hypothetical protein M431DRAFT_75208 [Trichoderma harzianum CBS 226.95]KAK0765329.1 hypothetical protein N5P37_001255 [Trichoderma harzianum]PKK44867.1 hypothetical protein CI102_12772 [Trichoderma harzianum]PTB59765.1 hypothetical protein M431DRAFT_75208 [Trichoderma harzianum CBS 226.95]
MHHFVAIILATSPLALAHHSITATRHFSRPVQPTAFADDPALNTPRPLVILTPSESDLDDVENISSSSPTVEATTIPFEDIDPVLFIPSTASILHSPPSSTSSSASSTPFPSSTTTALANHPEKRLASSSSPSLTTITGTRTTTSSSTSNPASVPTAFANAAVGLIAIVGLAMAL